jgi:predicted alpha-1,2-mannosidase
VYSLAASTHVARADVAGFGAFAPPNVSGTTAGSVGYDRAAGEFVLTDGGRQESCSAFAPAPQRVVAFSVSFTYQASKPGNGGGDGIAFVVQNDPRAEHALGDHGDAVGYGGPAAIAHSFAVRLAIYSGSREGIAIDGVAQPYEDTSPVDLPSGDPIRVRLDYDGSVVSETLRDDVTGDIYTEMHAADIPAAVGGQTALVGVSGASGDATARQTVRDFTFTELPPVPLSRRKHIVAVLRGRPHDGTLASYVDPFIGTGGGGNTYPGAVTPFGMVQFSPDTGSPGVGYTHGDRRIAGFSLTHMSGVGCDDYGDVFLTATTGPVKTAAADTASTFSHRREAAEPGYYRVTLLRPGVDVELTATDHAGLARFTFPEGQSANILVPISHSLTYTRSARVEIVGDHEIVGQVSSQSFCGAQQFITIYFVMDLDHPFHEFGTFQGDVRTDGSRSAEQIEKQPGVGAYVSYPASAPRVVTARIGISFVDNAGARRNLASEVGASGFDAVRTHARAAWEKALRTVDVTGGTDDQRTVFYTSLYHSLLMPNVFSDVDGRYIGFDGQVHQAATGHAVYANYSGWDIYRTEAPLLALIAPKRMADMCESIALMYQQGGWIDRWPQANTYTNVMCGSPLTSVAATAWNYGLHGFDMQSLYPGMLKDATLPAPPGKPYQGESNVAWMDRVGYIPDDKETYGSVSQTEEDCLAYAALASVAEALGKTDDAASLRKRALGYRNLFDPATRFLRPRTTDGTWVAPFDPAQDHGYVEGSALHYRWLVPQDVAGLIRLFGGDDAFNTQLDAFFAYPHPEWDSHYYNPYNEPDLQAPFLYDYSGEPWKTQAVVRSLLAQAYLTTPEGIPGNDDCGTMSAWCVLGMLGLYPTDPGHPAFELCSPVFPRATITLDTPYTGGRFTILAPEASDANPYVQSARVDGAPTKQDWIPQSVIAHGGTLSFTLGAAPNRDWGTAAADRPPSFGR